MATKDKNNALKVSSLIFGLVTVVHLVRALMGSSIVIGSWDVPLWASWLAVVIAGALSWWTWTSSH